MSDTRRQGSEKPNVAGPRLVDRVRRHCRVAHLAIRAERAYVQWIERFRRFHHDQAGRWRHSDEMDSSDVNAFLTHLAVERHVAASTHNQALSALLLLFQKVLKREISLDAVRAKRPRTIARRAEH